MLFNHLLGVYCFHCNQYINAHTEVYLDVLYEGSISCKHNHLVGNQSDQQWIEFWGEDEKSN